MRSMIGMMRGTSRDWYGRVANVSAADRASRMTGEPAIRVLLIDG